jgi:hypothetical protein
MTPFCEEIPCLLRNPAVYQHIHKIILPNAGGMLRCLCTDVKHWFVFMRNEICGNCNEVSVRTRPRTNRLYNEAPSFRQQTLPAMYWAFYMKLLAFITDSEGLNIYSVELKFFYTSNLQGTWHTRTLKKSNCHVQRSTSKNDQMMSLNRIGKFKYIRNEL